MPSLIEHYYNKVAEFNNERRYLIELEIENRDECGRRMLQADQGMPIVVSDDDFEASYAGAYQQQMRIVDEAMEKIRIAKQVCIGEGLDPDAYLKPQEDPQTEATSEPGSLGSNEPNGSLELELSTILSPKMPLFDQFSRATPLPAGDPLSQQGPLPQPFSYHVQPLSDRVKTWIQDVAWTPDEHHNGSPNDQRIGYHTRAQSESRQSIQALQLPLRSRIENTNLTLQVPPSLLRQDLDPLANLNAQSGLERPTLLKRSSSESAMPMIVPDNQFWSALRSPPNGLAPLLT